MIPDIKIEIHNERALQAMERMPGLLETRVDFAMQRGAEELARKAMANLSLNRSMARSTLNNSIKASRVVAPNVSSAWEVHWQVRAGVNYAASVEYGSGPAIGKPSYMPNSVFLRDYIKQRGNISFAAKQGSTARRAAIEDVRASAFLLARHIRRFGTKPHPFMEPARKEMEPRIRELVVKARDAAINEALGS